VVKGDMVRFEEIPLQLIVPGLGVHARGTRLLLDITGIDELNVDLSCRLVQVLDSPSVPGDDVAAQALEEAAEDALDDAAASVEQASDAADETAAADAAAIEAAASDAALADEAVQAADAEAQEADTTKGSEHGG
jgi:exoribonuclease-2